MENHKFEVAKHGTDLYSIRIIVRVREFRKLCKERRWYRMVHLYEEALEMAEKCVTFADLVELAKHIERFADAKRLDNIEELLLNCCCGFSCSKLDPLPESFKRKSKIRQILSHLKGGK